MQECVSRLHGLVAVLLVDVSQRQGEHSTPPPCGRGQQRGAPALTSNMLLSEAH